MSDKPDDLLQRVRDTARIAVAADGDLHRAMVAAVEGGCTLRDVGRTAGYSYEYVRLYVARSQRVDASHAAIADAERAKRQAAAKKGAETRRTNRSAFAAADAREPAPDANPSADSPTQKG